MSLRFEFGHKNPFKLIISLAIFLAQVAAFSGPVFSAPESECVVGELSAHLFPIAELSRLPKDSDLNEIQKRYQALMAQIRRTGAAEIDSRRLINEDDWWDAIEKMPQKPWLHYGRNTMADFLHGIRYINRDAEKSAISLDLLKKIHAVASEHLAFHGFEGRRIRKKYDEGKITKEEFHATLVRVYKYNEEFNGVSHKSLRGKLRSDSIDEIEHGGSSFLPGGTRYFTERELAAIRANPYMKVDERSLQEFAPGHYKGRAYYQAVARVEESAQEVIERTNRRLEKASTPEQVLAIVIQMEKDLISIHPFLDGNGRTIRLMGDLILQRHGLPPPLYPNESDLVMTSQEAFDFNRLAMIDYLNEWLERLNKRPLKSKG